MKRMNALLGGAAMLLVSGSAYAQSDPTTSVPSDTSKQEQQLPADQSSSDSDQSAQPIDETKQEPIYPSAEEPTPPSSQEPTGKANDVTSEPLRPSNQPAQETPALSGADLTFEQTLAAGGMVELQASKMALERGTASVKTIAKQLKSDHEMLGTRLQALAAKKNVTLPTEIPADQQATLDRLSKLSGREFDRAYLDAMLDGHKKTIQLFADELNNGKDADVIGFAASNFPTIITHFSMVNTAVGEKSALPAPSEKP